MKNEKVGKFNLSLSATYIQKLKTIATAQAFNELTANIGLNYNF